MNEHRALALCLDSVEQSFADMFLATVRDLPASRAFDEMAAAAVRGDDDAFNNARARFVGATEGRG